MSYCFRKVSNDEKDFSLDYIMKMYSYNLEISGIGMLQGYVNNVMDDLKRYKIMNLI